MAGLAEAYAAAAARCRRAGFDLVELHGGHDYLLFQFLSPLDNRRDDAYGGSLDGRARFPLEVVRACRERVGDLPLSFRLSADEFAPGGFTIQEAERLAPLLESAGVDLVSVSAGSARSRPIPWLITTPIAYPAGSRSPWPAACTPRRWPSRCSAPGTPTSSSSAAR
jgi:2,4-dienoyl-CoA reductase-like NADH-dependent reductase (Old Yellow Enzyme family)